MEEAVEWVRRGVVERNHEYIVTPNLDHLVNLEEDPEFRCAYEHAGLILADGMPLVWLGKLFRTPIKEKVSGSDLFPRVCQMAGKEGFSLYILGAAPGVAEQAAANLTKKYGTRVVGVYSPAFGFEHQQAELDRMVSQIRQASPDLLAIALGDKKGEKFLCRYQQELGVPVSMSIGASIDFEAGTKQRAPKWVSNIGFEWFYRFLQEPVRLGRRYWRDTVKGLALIVKYYRKRL
ncbi:MAG: WecB/TagA/CpsF family glycosyltransferase [Faecousia sp.]